MQDRDKGDDLDPEHLPSTLIQHELNGEAPYSRRNRMRPRLSLRSQLNTNKLLDGERWCDQSHVRRCQGKEKALFCHITQVIA